MNGVRPGAYWDGSGVTFGVFSRHAERVDVCLLDEDQDETARVALERGEGGYWHGRIDGIGPGQRYGFRAHGPYLPQQGHRFDPSKLLIDPYARRLSGAFEWHPALFHEADGVDSAPYVPKSTVIDPAFDWGGDAFPRHEWNESFVYELHVKGFTKQHPDVDAAHRGTYLGLAAPAVLDYLVELGVTTVELMPCQEFVSESGLVSRGLDNYWGYNSLAFFAPSGKYAIDDPVREFKTMVKALHARGIEVILDVVFNHTAEGGDGGPILSFRGLDNPIYYLLDPHNPKRYVNLTGCGNTIAAGHPVVLRMIADCLRYWATEMRVDGFRFDLAPVLGRERGRFDRGAAFFDILAQDPVLSNVKLIAEPWDPGHDGYQLGNFPSGWREWNGKFRDSVRHYWQGHGGMNAELARRLAGSSDLFTNPGRGPTSGINYVACHDGFTLRDTVTYENRRNLANGEENRDGPAQNYSMNFGHEGPTNSHAINALRARAQRSMLATVFLAQGVPMVLAGDERNRTQNGNNNAYCQDNEISWMDWQETNDAAALTEFVKELVALRKAHPVLRRKHFLTGTVVSDGSAKDVTWMTPSGDEKDQAHWHDGSARGLMLKYSADSSPDLLILFNSGHGQREFSIGSPEPGSHWVLALDTSDTSAERGTEAPAVYSLGAHGVAVFEAS